MCKNHEFLHRSWFLSFVKQDSGNTGNRSRTGKSAAKLGITFLRGKKNRPIVRFYRRNAGKWEQLPPQEHSEPSGKPGGVAHRPVYLPRSRMWRPDSAKSQTEIRVIAGIYLNLHNQIVFPFVLLDLRHEKSSFLLTPLRGSIAAAGADERPSQARISRYVDTDYQWPVSGHEPR